jgi:hypothetical protein
MLTWIVAIGTTVSVIGVGIGVIVERRGSVVLRISPTAVAATTECWKTKRKLDSGMQVSNVIYMQCRHVCRSGTVH